MDMKKQMGAVAVLAVVMFGTAAGATPVARGDTSKEAQAASPEIITLKPGEVKDVLAKGAVRVSVGEPDIADISISNPGSELVVHLTGGEVGQTTLLVWFGDKTARTYEIIVQR